MTSRFDFIQYDSIAIEKQNELRREFKELEKKILAGDGSDVLGIGIPDNSYKPRSEAAKMRCYFLSCSGKLQDALAELEILYSLLGKEIRSKCMERLSVK